MVPEDKVSSIDISRIIKLEARLDALESKWGSWHNDLLQIGEKAADLDDTLRGKDGRNGLVSRVSQIENRADRIETRVKKFDALLWSVIAVAIGASIQAWRVWVGG